MPAVEVVEVAVLLQTLAEVTVAVVLVPLAIMTPLLERVLTDVEAVAVDPEITILPVAMAVQVL
jgi:hypothetical protein